MVLHFTMLYQFKVTAKDLEIDGLRVPVELLVIKNRSYTLVQKYSFFLWASAIRICHPLEVMLPRSVRKSWQWVAGVVVAESHDEAWSLPCSSACICQLVACRTQVQRAPWDTFPLTLSLLDNIQISWFTRPKTQKCLFFPSSLANKVIFEHIFIQNEMIQIHTAVKSIISDITSENHFAFFAFPFCLPRPVLVFLFLSLKAKNSPTNQWKGDDYPTGLVLIQWQISLWNKTHRITPAVKNAHLVKKLL